MAGFTFSGRHSSRDLVHKVAIDSHTVCESSLGDSSTLILESVVVHKRFLGAELLIVTLAFVTVTTGIGQRACTD